MQLQVGKEEKKRSSFLIPALILIGVCLAIAFGLNYADVLVRRNNENVRTSTLMSIMPFTWACCAISTPLFIWLSGIIRFEGWKRVYGFTLHIVVVLLISYLVAFLYFTYAFQMELQQPMKARLISGNLFIITLPFWLLITGIAIIRNQINSKERRLESERLRSQLAEAKLNVMNLQLQPHFLFNTMQGISTLMYTDVQAADKTLHGLSDFLRYVLTKGTHHEVTVREELDALSYYLDICEVRFEKRFEFVKNIDPDVFNLQVPFLLLQPLVENIFKHVVEKRQMDVIITLNIQKQEGRLNITLSDTGVGLPEEVQYGTGLKSLIQRLDQLYHEKHGLNLSNNDKGGLTIEIDIPIK